MGPLVGSTMLLVIGLGCLAVAVDQRRDRPGRSWPGSASEDVVRLLLALPGAGLFALGSAALIAPGRGHGLPYVGLLLVLLGLLMMSATVFGRVPMWWVPRWARAVVAHRREVEKRSKRNQKRRGR